MRFCEFQEKEVINVCDCRSLGNVIDIDLDECKGCIEGIIVPGPAKIFGMFGHDFEFYIPWKKIVRIGPDIILVEINAEECKRKL